MPREVNIFKVWHIGTPYNFILYKAVQVTTVYEVKSSSDRKSLYHMDTLEFDFRVGVFCTFYRFEQLFT